MLGIVKISSKTWKGHTSVQLIIITPLGNDSKTCAYFDEMSNLFQQDARIQPVTLCSSRAGTKIAPESKSDKAVTCSESENEDIPRKRKIKPQAKDDLVSLFKEFTQTREEREKERMQELREMHK